jgi:hypothetical protein
MENKTIKFDENELKHSCVATREGDWAIFKCPICEDYERRINLKTGEMKTKIGIENTIMHNGTMVPVGLQPQLYNAN